MKSILFINPFGIGDVLFTTPAVRAVRDSYPDAFIAYWCNQRIEPILKDNPRINKIFDLNRGDLKKIFRQSKIKGISSFWRLISGIRKERFDTVFDFSLDHRYSLLTKILGIKTRIGLNYRNRGRFLTLKKDIDGYTEKHVVEYYLDLLRAVNLAPKDARMELFVSGQAGKQAKDKLDKEGFRENSWTIGIVPGGGGSWGRDAFRKHWPAERFAQAVKILMADFAVQIVILGDSLEKPIADQILQGVSNKSKTSLPAPQGRSNLIDLAGKLSLEELMGVIDKLDILVANDGGPLHMAVALGKKTVSFFGPVDDRVYGPYPPDDKKHVVLKKKLECSPCYSKFRLGVCRRDKECLRGIEVEEAVGAIKRLITMS